MGAIERLAAFVKRVFPEKFLRSLDHRLEATKIALAAEEYVGVSIVITAVVGAVVGFIGVLLWLPIPAPLLAILAVAITFPLLTLGTPRYLAGRRAAELERELPDALRQMASTLRAGVGIDATLDDIVKSKYGALSDEFDRVVTEVKRGRTLESALLALARRSHSPLYERAFRLIVEGIERGAALASVLDSVSTDIKEVYAIQRERKAATTQQVLFLAVVALFAVPFVVGLTVSVAGAQIGGEMAGVAGPALPPEMGTIAMGYIALQGLICALAFGVVRYGRMSKGLTFALPFMIMSVVVFSLARTIGGSLIPA